jgi:hypothetical protein
VRKAVGVRRAAAVRAAAVRAVAVRAAAERVAAGRAVVEVELKAAAAAKAVVAMV